MHRYKSSISSAKLLIKHPSWKSTKPKSPISSIPSKPLSYQCSPFRFRGGSEHVRRSHPLKSLFSPPTNAKVFHYVRHYSTNTEKEVDDINLKFAEAREDIESAMDSKETVYFDEEAECARAAVGEVLNMYQGLLNKLPEGEKAAIQRAMGLKIEQLKAELQQLND